MFAHLCPHPQKYAHPYNARPTARVHDDGFHETVSLRMTCRLCGKDDIQLKWLRLTDKAREEMGWTENDAL